MGFWRNTVLGFDVVSDAEHGRAPTFAVDADSIPAQVFGLESYSDPVARSPRVSRDIAMQCDAVSRARDLVPGTIGTLPLQMIGPDNVPIPSPLLDQPEPDRPAIVTFTETLEDMFFEGVAWWRVTKLNGYGYPAQVRKLDVTSVDVRRDQRVYVREDGGSQGSAWEWVPDAQLIRFDSPTDGLLTKGARAIRTALYVQSQLERTSRGLPPLAWFTPDPDSDEWTEDEIADVLREWNAAREAGRTGFVPLSLQYHEGGISAEKVDFGGLMDQAILAVSRHCSVDPIDVGVGVASHDYQNGQQRRLDLTDFTLAKYLIAMSQRLSMNDVCPRGWRTRYDLDDFQRADTKTRYEAYEIGLRVGAITKPEIRDEEKRPPLEDDTTETPSAPAEVTPLRRIQ